jgi:hypothetical protein
MVEPLAAAKVSNARQWSSYLTVTRTTAAERIQQLIAESDERFVYLYPLRTTESRADIEYPPIDPGAEPCSCEESRREVKPPMWECPDLGVLDRLRERSYSRRTGGPRPFRLDAKAADTP